MNKVNYHAINNQGFIQAIINILIFFKIIIIFQGGKYYFMEHVAFKRDNLINKILNTLQNIIQPVQYPFSGGDHCNRKTWLSIKRANFQHCSINFEYVMNPVLWNIPNIWGHAIK